MNKVKEVRTEYGSYFFKLEQLLFDRGISINKVICDTETDFKVLKRIITGDLSRINITVLAKLCNYLQCEVIDIVCICSFFNNEILML